MGRRRLQRLTGYPRPRGPVEGPASCPGPSSHSIPIRKINDGRSLSWLVSSGGS